MQSEHVDEHRSDEALRHALDGTAMLFVGSGVGFLAKTTEGSKLPNGKALSDLLHAEVQVELGRHSLQRISQYALRKLGPDHLFALLQKHLKVAEVDPRLKTIYNAPWQRIYTTNYDDAIEVARRGNNITSSFTLNDDPMTAPRGAVAHLNGFIDAIKPSSFDQDAVLTDTSYSINDFQDSAWARQFLVDVRTSRSIIFVGYSMSDLDIVRLLLVDQDVRDRTLIYVSPDTDEVDVDTLSSYGIVRIGGFDDLYERFMSVSSSYVPIGNAVFSELRQIKIHDFAQDVSPAETVHRQLVYGRVAEKEFLLSDRPVEGISYLGNRSQLDHALKLVKAGVGRDVFIHGELASGKSCACLLAAKHFLMEDHEVYVASHGPQLSSDLERLATRDTPICVIFDGYGSFIDEIKAYAARRRPAHKLILTERTVSHDLIASVVERAPGFGPSVECYLNRIEEPDLANFADLINFAGLWGDRSGLSRAGKITSLRRDLNGSLYFTLLEVIKSQKVQDEIKRLLTPLTFDRKALLVFTSAFIVSALGFKFEINDWQNFYKIDSIRRLTRNYSEQFLTFMSVRGDEMTPRSGLLSSHILKSFASDTDIVDCLYTLYKAAAEGESFDPYLADLRIELMRYGAVERMLSDTNKHTTIINYYNRIRSVRNTVDNADYWLQLGIASTSHNDLNGAQIAFDNAYEREKKKKNPLLKRIDNYYSRFEMKKAVAETDSAKAFNIFYDANDRLSKQMLADNNRHYPFKTSREFVGVAARHFDKWSEEQQSLFLDMMRDVRRRAIVFRDEKGDISPDIAFLIKETAALLSKLGIE
jgi:hypothetical protein